MKNRDKLIKGKDDSSSGAELIAVIKLKGCFLAVGRTSEEFNSMCSEALKLKLSPMADYICVSDSDGGLFMQTFMSYESKEDASIKIMSDKIEDIRFICESDVIKFNEKVKNAIEEGYGFKARIGYITENRAGVPKAIEVITGGFPEYKSINNKLHFTCYAVKWSKSIIDVVASMPRGLSK